jgi:hypothetical protein
MAEVDRQVGTLLVADPGTRNIIITTVVNSDPCPSVEWSFAGSPLLPGNSSYLLSPSPCGHSGPYSFNLTIGKLGAENSGKYSAVFDNGAGGITHLPGLVVSTPGNTLFLLVIIKLTSS